MSPESSARFDSQALEAGRVLFSRPITFLLGAASLEQLPTGARSEIAFAGRSNSGKSSLINALTGRSRLARASNAPGRTRELNCFEADGGLIIVDLPGYGYAKADKKAQAGWQKLSAGYLATRRELKRVFLLIDSRRGAMSADFATMDLLDAAAVNYQLVLTKIDKLSEPAFRIAMENLVQAVRKRPAAHPAIHATSSSKRQGLDELRAEIALLAAEA